MVESCAVVVTTCDYGHYLADCMRSLDAQTLAPDEILVVDDASVDETANVLDDVISRMQNAERVRIVRHQSRRGFVASLNEGIAATCAPLVAHVDADDTVEPTYLEKLARALTNDPGAGYAYPRLRLFGAEHGLYASYAFDPARLIFEGNYIPNVALMRREAFRASGGFHPLRTHVDWDLWLSFLDAGWPGVLVDEPLYNWRRHAGAMTYQPGWRRMQSRLIVMARHRGLIVRYRSESLRWTARALARRLPGPHNIGSERLTASGWVVADPQTECTDDERAG